MQGEQELVNHSLDGMMEVGEPDSVGWAGEEGGSSRVQVGDVISNSLVKGLGH